MKNNTDFRNDSKEYETEIEEVRMGSKKAQGGTRGITVTLGGERQLPFYPDTENPNKPVVTFDVFDREEPLPGVISEHYKDVIGKPAEWAKKSVKEFGADMVTLHLTSTDPDAENRSPKEAAKTVEDVLDAVDVPLVIGGSGNPRKDPEVLAAAAEAAEGEKCLLASVTLDLDWRKIAQAAIDYDHNVLAWTTMDINLQRELNRRLMNFGLDRDRIVMDPTTAAMGYGLEYSFSVMQRIRMAGLDGDDELNFPISNGVTNAWGAREAWMGREEPKEKYGEDWGVRDLRGPLWEVFTGVSMILAGSDLLMALHPKAVDVLNNFLNRMEGKEGNSFDYNSWIKRV